MIEAIHGPHQTDVSFLNQIQQVEAVPLVTSSHMDNKAQSIFDGLGSVTFNVLLSLDNARGAHFQIVHFQTQSWINRGNGIVQESIRFRLQALELKLDKLAESLEMSAHQRQITDEFRASGKNSGILRARFRQGCFVTRMRILRTVASASW